MKKQQLARAATIMMLITLISKGIGFLRDTLVASSFGATYKTDAYNMSITISEIVFAIFSLAITTTFIPILSDVYRKKSKEDMFKFSNNIMNILLLISIILCALGWQFADILVKIVAPKFTGEAYALTVTLTRISVINIIFMSLNAGYTAILQTLDDFLAPSMVGIMLNFPIIIYILIGAKGGVVGLAVATLIGNVLKVVIQVPWLIKHGYVYRPHISFKDPKVKKMFLLIVPVIVGASANQLNAVIDRAIGSSLPEGSISALNFSSRITDVVYVTFATAIVTVIYPTLSREALKDNYDSFKFYIVKAINNINIIMIPCTVGVMILSYPLIVILFKHGIFDDRAVRMTVTALVFYSISIPFSGVRDVFNRALYAINDTKTSTANGIVCICVNIGLNLLLVGYMGIGGIALSTSMAAVVGCFLLMRSLSKKIGGINGKEIVRTSLKIIIASAVMGLGVFGAYRMSIYLISGLKGMLIGFILSVILGVVIYSIILMLLKVEEFYTLLNNIKNKIGR